MERLDSSSKRGWQTPRIRRAARGDSVYGHYASDPRANRVAYHLYLFKFFKERCKNLSKEKFIEAVKAEGIPVAPGYARLYKQGMLATREAKRI